jgi:hypothetical protein
VSSAPTGEWVRQSKDAVYPVDLVVDAADRQGLLRDISEVLSREKINVTAVKTQSRVGLRPTCSFVVEVPATGILGKSVILAARSSRRNPRRAGVERRNAIEIQRADVAGAEGIDCRAGHGGDNPLAPTTGSPPTAFACALRLSHWSAFRSRCMSCRATRDTLFWSLVPASVLCLSAHPHAVAQPAVHANHEKAEHNNLIVDSLASGAWAAGARLPAVDQRGASSWRRLLNHTITLGRKGIVICVLAAMRRAPWLRPRSSPSTSRPIPTAW